MKLVCVGKEEWEELVRVVEVEGRGGQGRGERSGEGQVAHLGGGIRAPEDFEMDEEYYHTWEVSEKAVRCSKGERRAEFWDEDTLWGDVSPETQRRLNALLGR